MDPRPRSVGSGSGGCWELWCRSKTWLGSRVAVAVAQAGSCSSHSTPSLGTSICHRCGPKIAKKKTPKNKQKKPISKNIEIFEIFFKKIHPIFLDSHCHYYNHHLLGGPPFGPPPPPNWGPPFGPPTPTSPLPVCSVNPHCPESHTLMSQLPAPQKVTVIRGTVFKGVTKLK